MGKETKIDEGKFKKIESSEKVKFFARASNLITNLFFQLSIGIVFLLAFFFFGPGFENYPNLLVAILGYSALIIFSHQVYEHDDKDNLEQASGAIKNWVEIILLITAAFITIQSDWFDRFFRFQTVAINVELADKTSGKPPIPIMDSLKFKYTFYVKGKENQYPKISKVLTAKNGMISGNLTLPRKYRNANVRILDSLYLFELEIPQKQGDGVDFINCALSGNIKIVEGQLRHFPVMVKRDSNTQIAQQCY